MLIDESAVTAADLARWQSHLGRTEIRKQLLDLEPLRRFAAALGTDPDVERHPPPLAHWAYFLDVVNPSQIGNDGHPKRDSGILPPIHLPRRMFAGSAMRFCEPFSLGLTAELTLSVAGIKHRVNNNGDRVFVEIDRQIRQEGIVRVIEHQTIVYAAAPRVAPSVQPCITLCDQGRISDEDTWSPSPVDLFRFSAATFNSHRIHYDIAYAKEEEHYPTLVVQGPLTAAKLLGFVQRNNRIIRSFSFRATAPLFVGSPIRLVRGEQADEVRAIRCDGVIAMSAWAA